MEILRKICLLLILMWVSNAYADQVLVKKGYVDIEQALMSPKSANYLALYGNDNSIKLFNENIGSFKHLRGVVIFGEVSNTGELWSALSELSLLEYMFLFDNNLSELEIGGTTSTLKYLWIRNSPKMDSKSINVFLTRSNLIQSLRFDGIEFTVLPTAIQKMPLLTELQISNSNLSSKEVFKLIGKENKIERLLLTDNNFQFFSKGLKKMDYLKLLDLSSNNFSGKIKHLEKVNSIDTLILNRNSYESYLELAQQIQKTKSQYLVLDQLSEAKENQLAYLLPGVEIIWDKKLKSFSTYKLPSFQAKEKVILEKENNTTKSKDRIKTYTSKSDTKLLSEAYLEYEKLTIPQPLKDFDTTRYINRYNDSSYIYMEKIKVQNHTRDGRRHKLKYSRAYGGIKKKKGTVKIDHYDDSHIQFSNFEEKECTDGLVISMNIGQIEGYRRTVLNAFKQFVWYVSTENEESFKARYITQKAWSDVRINYENNEFTVLLKGRFEDEVLEAEPRFKRDPNLTKNLEKTAKKAYERYLVALNNEEKRYNKSLVKEEKKLSRPYNKDIEKAWKQITAKMSEEEKLLSRSEWLDYYDDIKKNEFALLPEKEISLGYLSRFAVSQGFKEKRTNDFYVGQKWVDANILFNNDTLNLNQLCIIDLDQKMVSNQYLIKNKILLEPFHDLLIYGLSKDGLLFRINQGQIEDLFENRKVMLTKQDTIDKNLTTKKFFETEIVPKLQ